MGQHSSIDHTGLTGVSTLAFGSNSNSVSSFNSAGASPSNTRADHVHLGVTSIAHTSNSFSGPVTLTAGANVGITVPTSGTYRIDVNSATGGGGTTTVVPAHGARVKRASGNFSVGNNTWTAVEFNAEDFDTDTIHSTVTNTTRLVVPTISGVVTGLWSISGSGYSDQTTGRTDVMFRINAAGNPASGTPIGFSSQSAGLTAYGLETKSVLTAADYVECFVRTTAGAGNVVYDAEVSPIFSIAFLGKVS